MLRKTALRSVSCTAALLLLATAPLAMAGNKEDLMAGVQKLDDSASYSWTTTSQGGRGGNMDGKTQKDGPTVITIQGRNGPMQVVMMGDQIVAQTQDGWQNLSEMQNAQGPGRFMAMMLRNMETPASQIKTYLKDVQDVNKADDGSYSVDMPEDTAKRMLTFGGRRRGGGGGANGGGNGGGADANGGGGPQTSNAKATGKFWLNSDGVLNKMEVHVTGTVSFNGNDRDVDRTTTTEIKDIGSTTVDVPADAKAKLSGGGGGATTQPTP